MCVYLCAKFEVSSIILTSFKQGEGEGEGVILLAPPPPHLKSEPLKNPARLELKDYKNKRTISGTIQNVD